MSSFTEKEKLANIKSQFKIKCKCSHTVCIYPFEHKDYKICSWCGKRVYKDKQTEFKYVLREKMGR